MTIIAYGTSLPETSVSLVASLRGKGAIAVGNIVGSNIANVLLVLGIALLVRPMKIRRQGRVSVDAILVVIITTLFLVLCVEGQLTRGDGIILLLFFAGYIAYYLRGAIIARRQEIFEEAKRRWSGGACAGLIVIGIAGVIIGAEFLVRSCVGIATQFGIAPEVIGLSLVAFGTSVPELATSVMATHKGEADLSIGNVLGSNVFNITLVGGIIAVIATVQVSGAFLISVTLMLLVTATLIPLMARPKLTRALGAGMVVAYLAYIFYIFL